MIQRAPHAVISISIVEFDPNTPKGDRGIDAMLNQDTKFTVRADTVNGAIDKAIKRLKGFKDEEPEGPYRRLHEHEG